MELEKCVLLDLLIFSILFTTPRRAFGNICNFLTELGQRPFLKRFLSRNAIVSSISAFNTDLNDALFMFGVRAAFHMAGHSS
jgi:hypothetical protein